MKFLCKIGIHKWKTETGSSEKCIRCDKEKMIIQAIMHDDLLAMVKSGELSKTGYLSVIKKGYLENSDFDLKDKDLS